MQSGLQALPISSAPGTEAKGLIFEIRRFCLHDGPGIRTTIFLKGCPLSCLWCQNPEGRSFKPSLMYFAERCRHCGDCVAVCPHGAIREVGGEVQTGPECQACGTCLEACQSEARQLSGRWISVPELVQSVEKDRVFFDESQGGVTFSGGEPFYQPAFLSSLLDACRERGIHAAVETCGFVKPEILLSLRNKVDLFLFDVKLLDSVRHKHYTGVSNELILKNLERLAHAGAALIVRVPIVPLINDSAEEMFRLGRLLHLLRVTHVHLLPYHRAGSGKYARLRMSYALPEVEPPTAESMEFLKSKLEKHGLNVTLGGQS